MNRLRVATLYLLVLVLVAGALPVTDSLAKWSRRSAASKHRKQRRHSRAWWRRHRARMRARRERAERLRRERESALASSGRGSAAARRYANAPSSVNVSLLTFDAPPESDAPSAISSSYARANNVAANVSAGAPSGATAGLDGAGTVLASARRAQMPFDFAAPANWTPSRRARQGEAVYTVLAPDGRAAGTAVIAPVTLSNAQVAGAPVTPKTRTIGGLPVGALRRTVIDRMVAEGGWVTNDVYQESHGRRVFVVTAQTGAPGAPTRTWTYYFTEVDGRVYSLATTAPVEFAAPVASASEQLMASLRPASSKNMASQK